MELTLKFYYPAHQISICFLLTPLPIFFLFFLLWDYACGKNFLISLSAFPRGIFLFSGFIFFFPAKFICLVIQLLSVSHVLLLFPIPDHLLICHQVHHVLLAEHLQLLDSFSSENAGCYHHWYNWSELWLWTVIRWGFFLWQRL